MKYYSDITKQLYETREELFKAERDYKTELVAKARAGEKAKKIADLEAQLAELRGESAKATTALNTDTDWDKRTAPTDRTDTVDYSKTAEAIKKMIDKFKFKYPSFEFPDVNDVKIGDDEDDKDESTVDDIKTDSRPGAKTTRANTEKTAPTAKIKTNNSCGNCGKKCVKTDGDKKKGKLADSGYYSSAYVNLNGKEFYSEGADSWDNVKKAVREYFEKLHGLK